MHYFIYVMICFKTGMVGPICTGKCFQRYRKLISSREAKYKKGDNKRCPPSRAITCYHLGLLFPTVGCSTQLSSSHTNQEQRYYKERHSFTITILRISEWRNISTQSSLLSPKVCLCHVRILPYQKTVLTVLQSFPFLKF